MSWHIKVLDFRLEDERGTDAAIAPRWMVMAAAIIGGATAIPVAEPQISIDAALVLSRVVQYEPHHMMAEFHLGWWTLVNQLSAVLLQIGLSQPILETLPAIASIGTLAAAYAMLIYGVCPRPIFSLFAAVLLIWVGSTTNFFESPDYGAYGGNGVLHGGLGTTAIYGLSGAAVAVLAIAALAGGRNTLAGFSAALSMSVHPIIGAYIFGNLVLVLILGRFVRAEFRSRDILKGMAFGAVVVASSFTAYLVMRPATAAPVDTLAYAIYLKVWDGHRNIAMGEYDRWRILSGTIFLSAVLCLTLISARGRRPSIVLCASILLSTTVCSTVLYFGAHLIPEFVPSIILRAIPGRMLDIHAYLSGPLLVGLSALALVSWCRRFAENRADLRRLSSASLIALSAFLIAAGHTRLHVYGREYISSVQQFTHKRTGLDDPFWIEVRNLHIRGLVLTSYGAYYPTLRYGHLAPIFDPTDFDFAAYLPHVAKEVSRLVEIGYGVSFSDPPPEFRYHGALPVDAGREYWEELSTPRWHELADELGITALILPSDWRTALPIWVSGPQFTVYRLP